VYAIIRDRGMQYRVEPGQTLDIDLLEVEPGATIELAEVMLLGGEGDARVGAPLVDGARVLAEVVGEVKGEKIVVFRYKPKKRYRRRTGHRQRYTRIKITEIVA
jgi:large subunit ribosomal protein L21